MKPPRETANSTVFIIRVHHHRQPTKPFVFYDSPMRPFGRWMGNSPHLPGPFLAQVRRFSQQPQKQPHTETLPSQKRCFRYHIPIPRAGFYDNGRFVGIRGVRLYHPATCGFHDNGLPATNGTRVRCSWPGFAPNRFAAVVAGKNLFRRMSRSDIARVSIGPFR